MECVIMSFKSCDLQKIIRILKNCALYSTVLGDS